jgi:hypothetical protein
LTSLRKTGELLPWEYGHDIRPSKYYQVLGELFLIGARSSVGKIVEALLVTSSRLTEGAAKLAHETGVKFVEAVDFTRLSSIPKYN